MGPLVKKVAGALAVKEVIDRVAQARRPKRSPLSRALPFALPVTAAIGGLLLFKSGKLDGLLGRDDAAGEPAAYPTGPEPGETVAVGAPEA